MNTKNIGTFPHKVYNYYTKDSYGNISLNKLLPLMLDSAGSHAEELGFSKDLLFEKGYTWVLSRVNVKLNKLFTDLETIYIDTWIQKVTSAFSVRFFEAHDGNGMQLAYGTTYWSIININTRRITPIQKVLGKREVTNSREVPCELPHKLIFERGKLVAQVIAEYSDLDYNGHVNSNRYVEWALNTFPLDHFSEQKLSQIEINYNHEVYWDDTISIYKNESGENIELFNDTQKQIACKMRLEFTPKGLLEM